MWYSGVGFDKISPVLGVRLEKINLVLQSRVSED